VIPKNTTINENMPNDLLDIGVSTIRSVHVTMLSCVTSSSIIITASLEKILLHIGSFALLFLYFFFALQLYQALRRISSLACEHWRQERAFFGLHLHRRLASSSCWPLRLLSSSLLCLCERDLVDCLELCYTRTAYCNLSM